MTFAELYERCARAAERDGGEALYPWRLSAETYLMWRGNAGNAQARRIWRRRDVPNTQRMSVAAPT